MGEPLTGTIIKQKAKTINGAKLLLECLHSEGVDKVFGYPGGIVLSIYDELYKCNYIKHFLVRHEQAAVHAAEGYARASGKVGVVITTSGPGATNTVTGILNAYLDNQPLVIITGQVTTDLIGKDAFQEANICSITNSCTKQNYLVKDIKDLPRIIKEAFYIAKSGNPGPVLIDLPKNVINQVADISAEESIEKTYDEIDKISIQKAVELLSKSKRPLIISGGGIITSNACSELVEFANLTDIPVANTMMGTGSFPTSNSLSLGMLGMNGGIVANKVASGCDTIIAIGTRFNDKVADCLKKLTNTKLIHIDINKENINKNLKADISIVGDAKKVLSDMILETKNISFENRNEWLENIAEIKSQNKLSIQKTNKISAKVAIQKIYEYTKDFNPIVCTEVGQHQVWAAQYYNLDAPCKFITSGGLGTMGFGLPAAMGVAIAQNDKNIINIAGDGSFQMNMQELMTCVDYNLNVKTFIINNGYLGMVRQMQEKSCDKRYSETEISSPDYIKLAKAYGIMGIRVKKEKDMKSAIQKAMKHKGPVLVDIVVESFEVL